jgi:geranylgeranyl pyrophosphate synthase
MSGPIFNLTEIPRSALDALIDAVEINMRAITQIDDALSRPTQATASSAIAYHLQAGGQRVRAKLALGTAWALGLSDHDAVSLASCAELLHNASLIHDDLQDGDQFRRGQPTLWSVYGKNLAICCGDLMLSAAYRVLCEVSVRQALPAMMSLVHSRTAAAINGQCADLTALDPSQDALEQYMNIAKAKSGALLGLPIELALLAAREDEFIKAAQAACNDFALSYQIFDDLKDLEIDALRDAAQQNSGSDLPPVLNIVFILSASQSRAEAVTAAVNLAHQHLNLCEENAARLPKRSGHLLIEHCNAMRSMLMVAYPALETI